MASPLLMMARITCKSVLLLLSFSNNQCSQYFVMESALSPITGPSSTIVCTEELHQELGWITRVKKWQKRVALNSYLHPKTLSVKQQKHTQYQYRADGSISYTLQCVDPPKNAQPTKNCQPPIRMQPVVGLPPAMMPDNEFSADMSWGADNDVQSLRRQRTMGVSSQTNLTILFAHCLQSTACMAQGSLPIPPGDATTRRPRRT